MNHSLKPSPLAPKQFAKLPPIAGVTLATANTGIRYQGRPDILLMSFAQGTSAAGVFTQSLTASSAIEWCQSALKTGAHRGLLVNAGNSNAFTGKRGEQAVETIMGETAKRLGCKVKDIYMASTGTIGVQLPVEKINAALSGLHGALLGADGWDGAARAIMTTDTFYKVATRTADIGGVKVTINGIAKGSGMIAPDMATLLVFVFTDAAIPQNILQTFLNETNARSFNSITVDGDTSTSDTALLFATGQAKHPKVAAAGDANDFREKLESLMIDLAQQVVKDGEGATKFVTVKVTGAEHDKAARAIAMTIGNSPLVKTAIAGEDANWGRIVAAVGRAGQKADRDKLTVAIGGVTIAKDGEIVPNYDETPVVKHMKGQMIDIDVDVGVGKGTSTIWTCDLTHGYIDINGSYRT